MSADQGDNRHSPSVGSVVKAYAWIEGLMIFTEGLQQRDLRAERS
jgi:hypothetical protein